MHTWTQAQLLKELRTHRVLILVYGQYKKLRVLDADLGVALWRTKYGALLSAACYNPHIPTIRETVRRMFEYDRNQHRRLGGPAPKYLVMTFDGKILRPPKRS